MYFTIHYFFSSLCECRTHLWVNCSDKKEIGRVKWKWEKQKQKQKKADLSQNITWKRPHLCSLGIYEEKQYSWETMHPFYILFLVPLWPNYIIHVNIKVHFREKTCCSIKEQKNICHKTKVLITKEHLHALLFCTFMVTFCVPQLEACWTSIKINRLWGEGGGGGEIKKNKNLYATK